MPIEGVTSSLPDPRYIKALEDKLKAIEDRQALQDQQIQVVSKR